LADIEVFNESGIETPLTSGDFQAILNKVESGEGVQFGLIEIVYVNEEQIVEVNSNHLGRDYITDIITFTYGGTDDEELNALDGTDIDGTIYMCAPRIIEQATELGISDKHEFSRIFIHGLLHLCGFDDTNEELKAQMTRKENEYLA